MKIIDHFENYVKVGFQPIPIRPKSKIPIGMGWNSNWSENGARTLFQFHPDANVGILLGNIVDVEGDTEEANDLLDQLIGDYPHPAYRGSKSTHHLFINPDENLTRISRNGVEFRAHKHQSVVPPSEHPDGPIYRWLTDYIPIPPLPPALLEFYKELQQFNIPKKKPSKPKKKKRRDLLHPYCPTCHKKITINRARYKLEILVFEEVGKVWECSGCRDFDVRALCRRMKKQLRYNR